MRGRGHFGVMGDRLITLMLIAALMIACTAVLCAHDRCIPKKQSQTLVNLVFGLAFFGLVWIGCMVWAIAPSGN